MGLLASIAVGILLRPEIYAAYPIGGDAGIFYSMATYYEEAWPLLPGTNPFNPMSPITSDNLPLLHWLMAGAERIFMLDQLIVTQFAPTAIFVVLIVGVYLLAQSISINRFVAPFAAFFISLSNFQMSYGISTYPALTNLSLVLMAFWAFSYVQMCKGLMFESVKWKRYFIACIVTGFLILVNHEVSILAAAIVFAGFIGSSAIFSAKFPTPDRFRVPKYTVAAVLGSLMLAAPILYLWMGHFFERSERVAAGGGGVTIEQIISVMTILPQPPLGAIELSLAFAGVAIALILTIDNRYREALYTILKHDTNATKDNNILVAAFRYRVILPMVFWLAVMIAITYSYLVGFYLINFRFMYYATVPLAVFAAFGMVALIKIVHAKFAKPSEHETKVQPTAIAASIALVALVIGGQFASGSSDVQWAKDHAGREFLNQQLVSCMTWIKENAPVNSLLIASQLNPYSAVLFLPGIAERPAITTLDPIATPGNFEEYRNSQMAKATLALDSSTEVRKILEEDLGGYNTYVFVGKTSLEFANNQGDKTNVSEMTKRYDKLYENPGCIIFHADPDTIEDLDAQYGRWVPLASGGRFDYDVYSAIELGSRIISIEINPVAKDMYIVREENASSIISVLRGYDRPEESELKVLASGVGFQGIAVNSQTNLVYVANHESDTISIIDGTKIVSTIAVGDYPIEVAVNPSTNTIYVANHESDTVSVIDGSSKKVIDTIPVGDSPNRIAVDEQKNIVYVSNLNSDSISIIDGSTNTVIGKMETEQKPSALALNPNTNTLYVANYFSDTVLAINISDETSTTISVGDGPSSIAVNPDTNMVYVGNHFSNTISIIDGNDNKVIANVDTGNGPNDIVVDPAGSSIYVANYFSTFATAVSETPANQSEKLGFALSLERGWKFNSASSNLVDYTFKYTSSGLDLETRSVSGNDTYVAFTKDIEALNLSVSEVPIVTLKFKGQIPEARSFLFQIDFTDGTSAPAANYMDVTEDADGYFKVTKDYGRYDKVYKSITIYAESYLPENQAVNHKLTIDSIVFTAN